MPQLEQIGTFPSQIFWLLLSFMALFIIMWRVAVPKISDTLEARQNRIDDNLERAADIKREAEAAIIGYEQSLNKARAEASATISNASTAIAEKTAKQEAELSEQLNAKIAESEIAIAAAVKAAEDSIRNVAIAVSQAATERLIGESPSNNDAVTAVDSVIKAKS